ncbi:hypothetical protein TNCV_438321 [Trichonephila clavipes]|nr:hypothetical protein TNCV_438321 [Trichonephila clavipes]
MLLEKTRMPTKQISEINIGRIMAFRDCGLYFREIDANVDRNQAKNEIKESRKAVSNDGKDCTRFVTQPIMRTELSYQPDIQSGTHRAYQGYSYQSYCSSQEPFQKTGDEELFGRGLGSIVSELH